MRTQAKLELGVRACEFTRVRVTRFKEIFLAQMANVCPHLPGNQRMVIDDKANSSSPGDGQDRFGHAPNLVQGGALGAELDQV
jgi:hypothetical protein